MANEFDNRNDRERRGPSGDYAPGESGFVRGYGEDRPDVDRYGLDRQRDFGYDGGYGGSGSRYPRMGQAERPRETYGYNGDPADPGYGDNGRSNRYADAFRPGYGGSAQYRGDGRDRYRNYGRDGDRSFFDKARDEVSSWFGDSEANQRRETDDHRGKGPRGYRRSDARILEEVNDRLSDDPSLDASDIEVSVDSGEVTLTGQVTDRWEKRRAEDCADHVSGVTHVQNNLRVRLSGEGSVMTQA
ncbi:BON domain-containing protein [Rhizobium glycinendophyticum]|nr:BON domain-containing protein [Rhizobium glycinendophyticum]